MNNTKVVVYQATHAQKCVPYASFVIPIQVGAKLSEDHFEKVTDASGDNISELNGKYCELTAIYWAWKNDCYNIVGLCHYRRIFKLKDQKKIINILNEYDIILPKPYYYRIDLEKEYIASHIKEDYDILMDILKNYYNEYYNTAKNVFSNNKIYPYNMFIMKKEMFDSYCNWIFDVLDKVDSKIDITHRTSYQKRYLGFLAERLFTIYVVHNNLHCYHSSITYSSKRLYSKKVAIYSYINHIIFRLRWRKA